MVNEILCNKCGETCMVNTYANKYSFYGETIEAHGGYSSPHFEDLTAYKYNICEKCQLDLFETFKIPVEIFSLDYNGRDLRLPKQSYTLTNLNETLDLLKQIEKITIPQIWIS